MKTSQIISQAIALIGQDDPKGAEAVLVDALAATPADASLHLVHGVALRAQGRARDGVEAFWHSLATNPPQAGARQALVESLVAAGAPVGQKDFSFASGERQTATRIQHIRADHRARYELAADWLRGNIEPPRRRTGLDVFCGNGYGSRMMADGSGARMMGLDGCDEAVFLANRHYGCHRVVFGHAVFPFALTPGVADFAVCFESAEHVEDPQAFLQQVSGAVAGPLFVSVPLEEGLPFHVNRARFCHHTRHFTRTEIHALLKDLGRRVTGEWGQKVYATQAGEVVGMLDPERMGLGPPDAGTQFLMLVAEA